MRLGRFSVDGKIFTGIIEGNTVFETEGGDVLGCAQAYESIELEKCEKSYPLGEVKLLAPVLPSGRTPRTG